MKVKYPYGKNDTNCNILHVDMDAFFASVEINKNPSLANKPVAVGGENYSKIGKSSVINTRKASDNSKSDKTSGNSELGKISGADSRKAPNTNSESKNGKPGDTSNMQSHAASKESLRGVISTANYKARQYGVHSAMSVVEAKRLCKDLILIPPDLTEYSQISKKIVDIFYEITPNIEKVSIDEAFLDVSGATKLFGSPTQIAIKIKSEIENRLHLPCSIGIAPNKLLAKLGSQSAKPNGILLIPEAYKKEFVQSVDLKKIWGIGKQSLNKLHAQGINTVKDLEEIPTATLEKILGSRILAENYKKAAIGESNSRLEIKRRRKSISKEVTLSDTINTEAEIDSTVSALTNKVAYGLRNKLLVAKTVNVKVKDTSFSTATAAKTLANTTDLEVEIYKTARELIRNLKIKPGDIRLIGVGVSNLSKYENEKKTVFDIPGSKKSKKQSENAVDDIRKKYGYKSINIGLH